ncbi:MAG: ribonuclease III [Propionibacteriaceae bacterium]|nr:ribonuclease III [Propionibacteriaceae bacterium]
MFSSEDEASPVPGTTLLDVLRECEIPVTAELLDLALTHRSYSYEHGQIQHNERLEFLGDSVLGVIVTERLFREFPDAAEGKLAKIRAVVVSSASLADVARDLQIGPMVKLGKGETATGGHDKTSILADTVEALIGAMYLTSIPGARRFVEHCFMPLIDHAATLGAGLDWKTSLQELCSQAGREAPSYEVGETGPDHMKIFTAAVRVGEELFPCGEGHSKKQAEQQAAQFAFEAIRAGMEPVVIEADEILIADEPGTPA